MKKKPNRANPGVSAKRAVVIVFVVAAGLCAASALHAFNPYNMRHVEDYGPVIIWVDRQTGRYATSITGTSTYGSLEGARSAALQGIEDYYDRRIQANIDAMNAWAEQMRVLEQYIEEMYGGREEFRAQMERIYRESWKSLEEHYGNATAPRRPDGDPRSARTPKEYFARFDRDADGKLSWGEIEEFQQVVYDSFDYRSNDRVLSPAEFLRAGGGDCDDFATFSAAFVEHFGYDGYVMGFDNTEGEDDGHAVAAVYIGHSEYAAGFYTLSGGTLGYDPRSPSRSYPAGNYVILDYWEVGTPGEELRGLRYVSRPSHLVGRPH
jgi:transglutaminase-like putative cysteine protease